MQANEARTQLLAQHERIRRQLLVCTELAASLRAGQEGTHELARALDELRAAFAEHNATETAVIRQLLHGPAAWGSLLVDRMLEEHVAEHTAVWELMSGTHTEIAARIDDLAEDLDAHMSAEERTFLSPMTLRDDVLRVRTREEALD